MNTSILLGVITVTASFTLASQSVLALSAGEPLMRSDVDQAIIKAYHSDLVPDQRRVNIFDTRIRYYGAIYLFSDNLGIGNSGWYGAEVERDPNANMRRGNSDASRIEGAPTPAGGRTTYHF